MQGRSLIVGPGLMAAAVDLAASDLRTKRRFIRDDE
jgi:hypothetical protein